MKKKTISKNGLELIKTFEGLRTKAYKDSAGVLTIGYGTTNNVFDYTKYRITIDSKITSDKADELLIKGLTPFINEVQKYDEQYNFTQNQFDALVSFAYNLGTIKQLTNNGKRTKKEISDSFCLYVYAGGVKLQGLMNRRLKEKQLFNQMTTTEYKKYMDERKESEEIMIYGKMGKKGELVKIIQIVVGEIPDGIYGKKTQLAVMEYQRMFGLEIDGIVGRKTLNKMCEDIKKGLIV